MLLLNLVLALVWMILTGQLTPLNFAIGFGLSYLLLWLVQRAAGKSIYFKKVPQVLGLTAFFVWELIIANLRVTYDIITPRHYMRPAVIAVPLDLESPAAITLLANLITLTPGTLSLDVTPDRRTLYIHSMHVRDADSFRREIKEGFERYIKEIFA
jgi:multicomponent Na+:H+ antiporter subunit E